MKNEKKSYASNMCVFKEKKKGNDVEWLLVYEDEESGWALPNTQARKGESSVRSAIRLLAEALGMNARILEEVSRSTGAARVSGKDATAQTLSYLMIHENGEELLEYQDMVWLDYKKAAKKLTSKKHQKILADAKDLLKKLQKEKSSLLDKREE